MAVFEGLDGSVDEVAVGGGVPSVPEGGVAVEAVAGEVGGGGGAGGGAIGGVEGSGEHVSEDLAVVGGEEGDEGENSRR